jgi:hypothetical protein
MQVKHRRRSSTAGVAAAHNSGMLDTPQPSASYPKTFGPGWIEADLVSREPMTRYPLGIVG